MKNFAETVWNTKWALSLTIGILLGLSWPPFPFPFLVFPAYFLLFRLIDLCNSAREAAYWSYPGFVAWNIITTYWMVMATVAGGIAAILANSAVMTLPVMLMYLAQKKVSHKGVVALLQTSSWISYEYLHHHWDLAWPWLATGNAWANVPELVQYISATGYLGISFWVLLVSALMYQATKIKSKKLAYGAAVVVIVFPLISLIQLQFLSVEAGETVETVVAQPNFDSYQDYGGFQTPEVSMSHLLNITDSVKTNNTELILWPENGLHPYVASRTVNDSRSNEIKSRLKATAAEWNTTIIGGAHFYEYFSGDEAPPLSRPSGSTSFLPYNAALAFQPDRTLEIYRKYNLVPIVERVPFVHFLNAIDVFGLVEWADIQGFGKGYNADQFQVGPTQVPALICYDSVFPSWARQFVTGGAGFITVITNDGWWGDTSGHEQHFAYARLRAIEFRRWVVRSANNGISGIIAPSGNIKVETEYWTTTAFRYDVPVINEQTLYARLGDWLPISMIIITGFGVLWIAYTYKGQRKDSDPNQT